MKSYSYRIEPDWRPETIAIAIVTALDDELQPVLESAPEWTEFSLDRFPHYYTGLQLGETVIPVVACSLWKYGQAPTTSAVLRLRGLRPKLIVMTGICAGWKKKGAQLGDVIVATRAFNPDEGKLTSKGMQYDTETYRPKSWLIKQLQSFGLTSDWLKDVKTPRPESLRYLGELLLCAMHTDPTPFSNNRRVLQIIKEKKLNGLEILEWLKEKEYLTKSEKLSASARKRLKEILLTAGNLIPTPDRTEPQVHYGTFGTGQSVVAVDEPFFELAQRVRSVRAIEMEVVALYQAVEEFEGTLAFAVKGVSDHATQEKDDRFRKYAAEVSAKWAIGFVKTKWASIGTAEREEDSKERHKNKLSMIEKRLQEKGDTKLLAVSKQVAEMINGGIELQEELSDSSALRDEIITQFTALEGEFDFWGELERWFRIRKKDLTQKAIDKLSIRDAQAGSSGKEKEIRACVDTYFNWILVCLESGRVSIDIETLWQNDRPRGDLFDACREVFEIMKQIIEDAGDFSFSSGLSVDAKDLLLKFINGVLQHCEKNRAKQSD